MTTNKSEQNLASEAGWGAPVDQAEHSPALDAVLAQLPMELVRSAGVATASATGDG